MENLIILNDVALPSQLLEATEKVVKAGKAKSRNELIARALRKELAAIKRAEIDAELAEMAKDPEDQKEVLQMEAEFANASWEAWQIGESEYKKG
ncbi:CopG family transcriptional regulator [Floridanema aerugineum]|uniref:CopG family transcriptional regulator n=1 Tax=Floridaenema aerugineum BLCC-F46 TaxID=3153654 RepID=A0ABV4X197_9CYAN